LNLSCRNSRTSKLHLIVVVSRHGNLPVSLLLASPVVCAAKRLRLRQWDFYFGRRSCHFSRAFGQFIHPFCRTVSDRSRGGQPLSVFGDPALEGKGRSSAYPALVRTRGRYRPGWPAPIAPAASRNKG
jgi:hypothetical protein